MWETHRGVQYPSRRSESKVRDEANDYNLALGLQMSLRDAETTTTKCRPYTFRVFSSDFHHKSGKHRTLSTVYLMF